MAADMQREKGQHIYPKLYVIGDSNTQRGYTDDGFLAKLASEYVRVCDIVARGFSGYTSDHLRVMIPRLLKNDGNPKGVIETAVILLGSNDCVDPKLDARHVPIERYKDNIQFIISNLRTDNVKNIILMSPPPVDEDTWGAWLWNTKQIPCANNNANLLKYVDSCKNLALSNNLHYIDLYNSMLANEDWKSYLHDGLHFSLKGNTFVFDKLKEVLDPIYANSPFIYPDYLLIDHKHPESSLL